MRSTRFSEKSFITVAVLLLAFTAIVTGSEQTLMIGNFSASDAESGVPEGWEQLTFKTIDRHTRYKLVREDDTVVVKAVSNASASGLIRKIRIDPKEYKFLTWRWKITNILRKGDATKKEGADFPARVNINFEYDPQKLSLLQRVKYEAARLIYGEYPPLCAIAYVWGNKIPKRSVVPSAYSDKAVLIIVESGNGRLNQWIEITRNIYEDYRTVFQEDPPPISGIAIMTDTDNTGESAVAYYGDIVLRKP